MTKIVCNGCFGGFGLSPEAITRYSVLSGKTEVYEYDIDRTDPHLVQVVEEMGAAANGNFSRLYVVELSPGTRYRIDEYDGQESVMTIDDYDWSIA
jgi:hypothetical protein